MQSIAASFRPVASRLVVRRVVAPAAPAPAPHRSFHGHGAPLATPTAAAAASGAASATKHGYDLYMWGGAKSSWKIDLSALTTSAPAQKSPLTTDMKKPTAVQSPDGTGFRDVSFGHTHAAFVTGSGNLYTFGVGPALGLGSDVHQASKPTKVEGLPPIVEVSCGKSHTIALSADGEVFTFGKGNTGLLKSIHSTALGTGNDEDAPRPVHIRIGDGTDKIAHVASGSLHNLVLTRTGKLYTWGAGENGRLGLGGSGSVATPQLVEAVADKKFVQISCGSSFNAALTDDGQVYMFGRNEKGQLGVGVSLTLDQYSMEPIPVQVSFVDEEYETPPKIVQVRCAYKHTLAIDSEGRLWTWGRGMYLKPNLMIGDDGWLTKERFIDCSGGDSFSAAVLADGSLVTWGDGDKGCLGQGNSTSHKDPAFVRGFGPDWKKSGASLPAKWMGRVVQVIAGHNHCAALTTKK